MFEPTFHKHAEQACGGCQIHVLDRDDVPGGRSGVALLKRSAPAARIEFAWRPPPYEYEHDKLPFDILAGSSDLREQIQAGVAGARDRAGRGNGGRRIPDDCENGFSLY